jgi:hypothetical protein
VQRYSLEFKIKALKLRTLKDFEVRAVAEPVDIPSVTAEGWPVSRGRPEQAAHA